MSIIKMNFLSPQYRQHKIYTKYSSSQTYFYSKTVNELVQQKVSSNAAQFQDLQYQLDDDEYMKRCYQESEFKHKMGIFKEYYFYHEDCARIFLKDIQIIYAKWQDRRRNLVYKKLKHMFNEDKSDGSITQSQQSMHGNTHVLYDLSEYNPFSKKYYLRTQNKKIRSLKGLGNQKHTQSREEISFLKHDLSNMLENMNQLSVISTLDSIRTQPKSKIYHKKSMTQTEAASRDNSNSNSNSIIKLNFKKKKCKQDSEKLIYRKNSKQIVFEAQKKKEKYGVQLIQNVNTRVASPKLNPNDNYRSKQKLKSKSHFEFTSLGKLGEDKNKVKSNTKRQLLRINLQTKVHKQSLQTYGTEFKKPELPYQGFQRKRTITIRASSLGKLKEHKEEYKEERSNFKNRQISVRKLKTKQDQFSDKKVALLPKKNEAKLSSYKSEQIDPKKALFKIKQTQTLSNKKKLQIKL